MNIDRVTLALLAACTLSGCATYGSIGNGKIDEADFGEANRQTMAAQVIDPDPQYDEPMATSADHAAQAIDRYRTDSVKQPDSISSRSLGGGSGGGGGGNGGGGNGSD